MACNCPLDIVLYRHYFIWQHSVVTSCWLVYCTGWFIHSTRVAEARYFCNVCSERKSAEAAVHYRPEQAMFSEQVPPASDNSYKNYRQQPSGRSCVDHSVSASSTYSTGTLHSGVAAGSDKRQLSRKIMSLYLLQMLTPELIVDVIMVLWRHFRTDIPTYNSECQPALLHYYCRIVRSVINDWKSAIFIFLFFVNVNQQLCKC